MEYWKLEKKSIRIKLKTGRIILGYVGDYMDAEDNEPSEESLILDMPDGTINEIFTKDIESVEIV